ncbi:type III-A CRISPR-associated RAMP protein Csm3 [Thermococcus piezophilus]|uniref:CRISPR system Cms endoribonuclease Csm3 n=1 Tax=Thermococcus piezophilus TaxID=1712654 RepID=A0A172WEC5_9EURY|nr:type III-A CRISPR-associated RAMP protein Csm3 [Thermococcus piezophilus]ANF21773.1 type III-A CRISPR-associated RAMP protein Csm3 [Thermococcus piezophilus]
MNRMFYGKIVIKGKIKAVTGLHIGSQREVLEIGGIDNPVIKDPYTGLPYIPGSSLKGRLRNLFEVLVNSKLAEWKDKYPSLSKYSPGSCRPENRENCGKFFNKKIHNGWIHACPDYETALACPVCRLFGASGNESNFPSRIIVRDAFLTKKWEEKWRAGEAITEAKIEVGIDRVTSQANLRITERVVADAEFKFEIIYNVENTTHWRDDIKNLLTAMALLEDSYLGGSGSRGYGKVEFIIDRFEFRPLDYYRTGKDEDIVSIDAREKSVSDILRGVDSLFSEVEGKLEAG